MGLAVDWIGNNLYWTDEGLAAIFVASLDDSTKRQRLLSEGLTHPRSIAVHPNKGIMFWSDWPSGPPVESENTSQGKIESAWLDGTHRSIIVSEHVMWANGLTVDGVENRLYWCDSYLQTIESISLDTFSGRIQHLSSAASQSVISRPYGLTFHDRVVFWSEFEKGHIMKLNLTTNHTEMIVEENPQLFSLKVFAQKRQPDLSEEHACSKEDTCDHLCLVTPISHTCACKDGATH